jgi:TctA family transporter
MFAICALVGLGLKAFKFSRVSFLIGFILSARIESSYVQFTGLYEWQDLLTRPLALAFVVLAVAAAYWGAFINQARIDFV